MAMRSGAHEGLMCPLEKGVRGIETGHQMPGWVRVFAKQIREGRKGRAECQGLGQQRHNIAKKYRPNGYQGIIRCRPKNSEAVALRSGAHEGLMCPLEKGVRGI